MGQQTTEGKVPILDNHVHLDPFKGRQVEAVKDFERVGGTHIIISHMPYEERPVKDIEGFRQGYDITIGLKDRVNSETNVQAHATVGPYPAELISLEKIYGLQRAKEIMMKALDLASDYVKEGKALAIGEVGRPHFPVSPEIWEASNEILSYAMATAKETGCAVVLHTESATPAIMKELADMARKVGLDTARVVKHYCAPFVLPEENHGLMPSVLASKDAIDKAFGKGLRFMMETDFLDDPGRPGAVLNITTVPKRTAQLIQKGVMRLDDAYQIHYDNPRRTYPGYL
jgi:TatD-related deoxyribonuclease